ncbi:MAG TPA: hypothetical protein VNH11_24380 [Pirellulales bacterium]|nr:hypothetical protein [Pirellulales bacterium]
MRMLTTATALTLACWASLAAGAEYSVEAIDAPPPAEELKPAIAERLSASGFKVLTGQGRTLCEVWPAKSWQTAADFEPTGAVNYPFEVGELLGAIRFARNGGDFRGQKIRKGTYTMRYGLQPQDGNHVGTSDTRDFVVLLPAADDGDANVLEKEALFKESTNASGTAHPAILSLLPPGKDGQDLPRIVHHEDRELWAVDFAGKAANAKQIVVELVVVGHSGE